MRRPLARHLSLVFVAILVYIMTTCLLWRTKYVYIDIENGKEKIQYVVVGYTLHEAVRETEFSRTVNRLGMERPEEWHRSFHSEIGLRRLFFPQEVSYRYQRFHYVFAMLMNMQDAGIVSLTPDDIDVVRSLVRAENWNGLNDLQSKLMLRGASGVMRQNTN